MRQMLKFVVAFLLVAGVCGSAYAIGPLDLVDLNTTTPDNLAVQLGFTGANATVAPGTVNFIGTEKAAGTFTNGLADGLGIQTGIVLTTGTVLSDPLDDIVSVVLGPNTLDTVDVSTENLLFAGDVDLAALITPPGGLPPDLADASALTFNFTTTFNTVTFHFVFGSEEFPVPLANDVMGIFIDGVNVALVPGTINPVSAFNLTSFNDNDPETLGVPTPFGTQLDGFSSVLTATATVTPNVQHTLKIAIAEDFDGLADSAVFFGPTTFSTAPLFLDVPLGAFAFNQIQAIAEAGITAGCGGGNFCPNSPITRAEMAVFLEASLGNPANVCAGNVFADVPLGSFACGFIERLAADGITGGCGGGNFCPNAVVTRAQMAVFIEAALGNPANACTNQFADSTSALVGATVCGFIERLAADGITAGCGGGNFCPNSPVTRAEMAVFLVAAPPPLLP